MCPSIISWESSEKHIKPLVSVTEWIQRHSDLQAALTYSESPKLWIKIQMFSGSCRRGSVTYSVCVRVGVTSADWTAAYLGQDSLVNEVFNLKSRFPR